MYEHADVLVIGAGQCGLALSRELRIRGIEHRILERHTAPGDVWRNRWDSLRLFTPAKFSSLPGMRYPGSRRYCPTAKEFADYLDDYADAIAAPLKLHETVAHAAWEPDIGFTVRTANSSGPKQWHANRLVIATGGHDVPAVPAIASTLAAHIQQLHTSNYHRPEDLRGQRILVVGAGASGVQLGVELARAGREVTVAGKPTASIPAGLLAVAGGAWFAFLHHVATRDTPIGRKIAKQAIGHGAPLIGISASELQRQHVHRAPRLTGAVDGQPQFADGSVRPVDAVLWATGYRPGIDWIHGLGMDAHGIPANNRGVSLTVPGLAFLGLPFQYGLTSTLIGGAGRDAAYLADDFEKEREATDG